LEKAGDGAEKGLDATGKGVGAAVEHTGRSVTKAGKTTGKAIADFFDGDDSASEDKVREVQTALQAKGYYSGPIDGIVGPKTHSGLSEYQKDEGLKVTGKVNDETAKRLGVG
jgi:peptidoglycan hydrolase-like protein with peptidoglycan-binding domain